MRSWIAAVVLVGWIGPALAVTPYDVPSGNAMATGGASAAHGHDNTALTVNPAALALYRRYGIAIMGGFFDGRDVRLGASAVDGLTTEGVSLGIAYQRSYLSMPLVVQELPGWGPVDQSPSTSRRFDTISLGLGIPLIRDKLTIGAGGTVVVVGHPILGNTVTGNATVGLAARPTRRWAVGLAGRNLIPKLFPTDPATSVVLGNRVAWTENQSLLLDVEVPLDFTGSVPVIARAGGEWGDDKRVVGAGYRFVGLTSEHWITLGAGLISDSSTDGRSTGSRGGLHYVTELPLHPLDADKSRWLAIRHTLTITIMPALNQLQRPGAR